LTRNPFLISVTVRLAPFSMRRPAEYKDSLLGSADQVCNPLDLELKSLRFSMERE